MIRALFLREFFFLARPRNMAAIIVVPAASAAILALALQNVTTCFLYPHLVLSFFAAGAVLAMLEIDAGNSFISVTAGKHSGLMMATAKIISSMSGPFLFFLLIASGADRFLSPAAHIDPLNIVLLPLLSTVTASWTYCLLGTTRTSMLGAIMIAVAASCMFAVSPSQKPAIAGTLLLLVVNFVILAACAPRLISEKR